MWSVFLAAGECRSLYLGIKDRPLLIAFYRLEQCSSHSPILDPNNNSSHLGMVSHILGTVFYHHDIGGRLLR